MEEEKNVPKQQDGGQTDTAHEEQVSSIQEAKELYNKARERLLDVSNWDIVCGGASAKFNLTDAYGTEVTRNAREKDFFRIDIPGPGTESGQGNDWVQIESIQESDSLSDDVEEISIKVRPKPNPHTPAPETAHFFADEATSTFKVKRIGLKVRAEVHGRNEHPNTESTGIIDTIRNAVVGLGAIIGLSTPQWKSLVKGLLEKSKDS